MANRRYGKAREAFASGLVSWTSADIRAVLIDLNDYTPNFDTHEFLISVPAGARVGTPVALSGKTNTLGVLDASDIVFSSVTGDVCEALLLYIHTGSDATARLIALIDTANGLPVAPNGLDISVSWDNGANKIMAV